MKIAQRQAPIVRQPAGVLVTLDLYLTEDEWLLWQDAAEGRVTHLDLNATLRPDKLRRNGHGEWRPLNGYGEWQPPG